MPLPTADPGRPGMSSLEDRAAHRRAAGSSLFQQMNGRAKRLSASIPPGMAGDYVMALNRLLAGCLMLLATAFLGDALPFSRWGIPILLWEGCGVALLVQLWLAPHQSEVRRLAAIAVDAAGATIILIAGGEATAFIYVVYLWIIIGNGFRFGKLYIFGASLASIMGFSVGILATPFWRAHLGLSFGLLFGIVVLPAYSFALIRQIAEARRLAERADHAKSLFLASISHELRTPLNAIIGTAELLGETPLTADQADMVATIASAADGQLSLVRDVLEYSRIEAGHGRTEAASFDLAELFSVVRAIVTVGAKRKGLLINGYITARTPLRLLGDERHLREVLLNLCENAIKFTDAGSVTIAADGTDDGDGRVRLRIEVADTGIGIAPESRQNIFELFTQANATILDRFGGTGLGLALCERQVRLMGGTIGVESAPGAGSIFWVDVTLARGAEAPVPAIDMLCVPEAPEWAAALRSRLDLAADAARASRVARSCIAFVQEGSDILPRAGADAAIEVTRRPAAGLPGRSHRENFVTSVAAGCCVEELGRAARIATALAVKRGSEARPPADAGQNAGDPPSPWAAMAGVRVLVADDNAINRSIVSRMLEGAGLIAIQAPDGEQALALMTGGAVDAALLDVNMPVMDGIEAAQFYSFSAPAVRIPLAALTADATPETSERCLRAGMASILVKPVRTAELLDAIAAMLPERAGAMPRHSPPLPARLETGRPGPGKLTLVHPSETADPGTPLDLATLADLHALGGADFVVQLVDEFRVDGAAVLEQLGQACIARDIRRFRSHAHSLCSIAANVGARSLRDLCVPWKDMSEAAMNRDADLLLARVRSEWTVTQAVLAKHVATAGARSVVGVRKDLLF